MNKKTILIVEDETAIVKILSDKLNQTGYTSLTAINGLEGFKVALSKKPDLILLDILMPVMDGITMLKKLREDPWGKEVPVIIFTNVEADESIRTGVLNTQPSFYIIKTELKLVDLIEKINTTLENL